MTRLTPPTDIPSTKRPYPRFVYRKVKDGQVRIRHRKYTPDNNHMVYDGRLEGVDLCFGLYWSRLPDGRWQSLDFIALWGTKAESEALRAMSPDDRSDSYADMNAPYIVRKDRLAWLPWYFWGRV